MWPKSMWNTFYWSLNETYEFLVRSVLRISICGFRSGRESLGPTLVSSGKLLLQVDVSFKDKFNIQLTSFFCFYYGGKSEFFEILEQISIFEGLQLKVTVVIGRHFFRGQR